METHNLTVVTEFILMGITDRPELQAPLFGLFLIIYLISLMVYMGMIILTMVDSRLQTPMYVFLKHLATIDLGYSTAVRRKMLRNFIVDQNTIPFYFCATQMCFFDMFIVAEFFILSAMFYDHFVAICKSLLYTVIMPQRVCWTLVTIPYLYGLLLTTKIFTVSFCGPNVISHFYRDGLPLSSLAYSNTHEIEVMILTLSAFNLLSSLLAVIVSYLFILAAILRMNSAEGERKAFSTCGFHLTVLAVFYGTLIFMYLQPTSIHSFDIDKVTSIFYSQVIPMLKPLIYSLRNKDVKNSLKKKFSLSLSLSLSLCVCVCVCVCVSVCVSVCVYSYIIHTYVCGCEK